MSESPRYHVVSFRVCDADMELILKSAREAGKRRGALARDLVMKGLKPAGESDGKPR